MDWLGSKIGANIGAALSQGYSQSGQNGGSVNSAQNYSNSANNSWNDSYQSAFNEGWSNAQSMTDAMTARAWSEKMAKDAWNRTYGAFHEQMDYNREEAEKQRQWQADMANTIYTRSVKNMKEAGINPILAYNMGLSGANVGSGATAALGGSPSAPLAQNFMDSWSASESYNHGSSYGESHGGSEGWGAGEGWSNGSSWNNGWSNSEEGIVTALHGLAGMATDALNAVNAGNTLDKINETYNNMKNGAYQVGSKIRNGVQNIVQGIGDTVKSNLDTLAGNKGGGHGFNKKLKK